MKTKQIIISLFILLAILIANKKSYACSAAYDIEDSYPVTGETVVFTSTNSDGATGWTWNFGDGATPNTSSNLRGPHSIVYTSNGNKITSLEVRWWGFLLPQSDFRTATVYVGLPPTPGSIGTSQTICSGNTPDELTSVENGGGSVNTSIVYEWETNASEGWATISGAESSTYQPPALTNTTSYRRRTITDWGGLIRYSGYTNEVTITVNPLPNAPTAGNVNITYDGTLRTGTATPPSGSSVIWYDAATGGNVTTAPSRTDVGSSSAWAESEVDATGCKSAARTQVSVTVTKKDLQVTAVAPDITYGDPAPTVTVQYSGFVSGDDASSLDNTGFTLGTDYTQGDNVGTYNTTIAIGTANDNNYNFTPLNTSTFTVGERAITITADAKSKTYGAADPALTYQITSGSIYGGDTPTGALSRVAGEDVGTYAIQQNTLTYGSNYNETYVGDNLTIGQANLEVTAVAPDITYGDPAPTVTVQYSGFVSGDNVSDLDDTSFTLGTDYTQGDDVGTYNTTIAIGTANDNNYNFTPLNTSTFTVGERAITITADAKSKTYGAADPALTYQITSGSIYGGDTPTGALSRVAGEDVGTYAIQQNTLTYGSNYNETYVGANLTIGQANLEVTAVAPDITYGDPAPTVTVQYSGFVSGDDASSLDNTGFTLGTDYTQGDDVGTYSTTIDIGSASDNNYNFTPLNTSTFNVGQRAITITADAKSKTYGAADPALTYQITSGSIYGGDSPTGALSRVAGEDVGTYAIQQNTLTYGSNYNETYVGDNLTIGQANLEVTAVAPDITYGDPAPTVTVQYSGFVSGDDASSLDNTGFTLGTDYTQGDDVGTYNTTIAIGSANDNNYNLTPLNSSTLNVGQRAITITADAKNKTYGDADPALTYQITSGSIYGGDTPTGALSRIAGEDVGTYAIQQNTLTYGSNYNETYVDADLTIGQANLEVTAVAPDITYGEPAPTVTVQYSGFVSGDDASVLDDTGFTLGTDYTQGDDVGTYNTTIAIGSANDNNYNLTPLNSSTFNVGQRAITITADAKNKTYGDADPALTYQITSGSIYGGDTPTGALSRIAGEDVGTYAIQQNTLTYGSNYNETYVDADLTIGQANLEVTAVAPDITYGEPAPTVTVQYSGFVSGDDASVLDDTGFTLGTDYTQGDDVGTYNTTIAIGSANDNNYNLTPLNSSTFNVGQRAITITADAKSKTYGDADPALTYQITSGSIYGGDTPTGALSRVAGEDVGTYAIQQNTLTYGSNYNETYVGANLTIGQANLEVTAVASDITYGDLAPTVTVQYSGFVSGDDASDLDNTGFALGTDYTQGDDVGTYSTTIAMGSASDNNYNFTPLNTSTFTVGELAITITADAKSKTYGAADPALTYQITAGSIYGGDTPTGSLSRVAGEDVGTYAIQQNTLTFGSNYNETYVGADLIIGQKPLTPVIVANDKCYDGLTDAVLSSQTLTGVETGDDVSLIVSSASFANAGPGTGITVIATGLSLGGTDAGNYSVPVSTSTTADIYALPSPPTTTDGQICIGSTATLSASGAASGQTYQWYNEAMNAIPEETGSTYTTPVLSSTTNYYVAIVSAEGCESSRTQVTAVFPAPSPDDQTTAGTDEWIGHVYDGNNFNTYYGYYNVEDTTFNEGFGGNLNCFDISSSLGNRAIYTHTFSVRYRMNTTFSGCYLINLRTDDGIRLFVDGVQIFSRWVDQAPRTYANILMPLNVGSEIQLEYYKQGGQNIAQFNNLREITNALTVNIIQEECSNETFAQISGSVSPLPTGITLSDWQWYYSTSPTGAGTPIAGATSENYTPSGAPFDTPGTYYVYRTVNVNSSNATDQNNWGATAPVVCTIESDRAEITVNGISATVSRLSANNDCPDIEKDQGFNPENGSYDAGSTLVSFRVAVDQTPVSQWSFTYSLSGVTLRSGLASPPLPPYYTDLTNDITVPSDSSSIDLHFYVNNNPPVEVVPAITITNISNATCTDTGSGPHTANVTIKAMPDVGEYE